MFKDINFPLYSAFYRKLPFESGSRIISMSKDTSALLGFKLITLKIKILIEIKLLIFRVAF